MFGRSAAPFRAAYRFLVVGLLVVTADLTLAAPSADLVTQLATGESDAKVDAIARLVAEGDPATAPLLQAIIDGEVQVANGTRVLIVRQGKAIDAVSALPVEPIPDGLDDVAINNRIRRELQSGIAALQLLAPDRNIRQAAVKALQSNADEALLPMIGKALEKETEPDIRATLALIQANIQLGSSDKATRLAAITALGESGNPSTKTLLLGLLAKNGDAFVEPDRDLRLAAEKSLAQVQSRLSTGERVAQIFSGVSLASILLLAALGLAITYGLMGVINMAHGELIMVGAYATYVVQNFFKSNLPGAFDAYLVAAVPVAFIAAAAVGMLLERGVIRFLYGRPLETLLATWGISLVLIQGARSLFGAQNVQVENPVWMSGGVEVMTGIVLPYSRIAIIGFAAFVLGAVWVLLSRTRLGLFVRAVTQNRAMASCVGVPTRRVDTWAFGLGSGIAGLAGCALSQIGNVGPDLGQSTIVDSFMVVVLGGVGQLAGAVYAALGLGIFNKFLEAWSGAVLAKIAILVFIIIFIQKRPQGLFAVKGRFADA